MALAAASAAAASQMGGAAVAGGGLFRRSAPRLGRCVRYPGQINQFAPMGFQRYSRKKVRLIMRDRVYAFNEVNMAVTKAIWAGGVGLGRAAQGGGATRGAGGVGRDMLPTSGKHFNEHKCIESDQIGGIRFGSWYRPEAGLNKSGWKKAYYEGWLHRYGLDCHATIGRVRKKRENIGGVQLR